MIIIGIALFERPEVSTMRELGFNVPAVCLLIGLLLAWGTADVIAEDWPSSADPPDRGFPARLPCQ